MTTGRPSKYSETAIYVLKDPRTGAIRYVGKTNNPARRLRSHICGNPRDNTPKAHWLRELQGCGLEPVMTVVEIATDWHEAERRWIREQRASGASLLNLSEGGNVIFEKGTKVGKGPVTPYRKLMQRVGSLVFECKQHGNNAAAERLSAAIVRFRASYRRAVRAGPEQVSALNSRIIALVEPRLRTSE
jgi:hypothetical protein